MNLQEKSEMDLHGKSKIIEAVKDQTTDDNTKHVLYHDNDDYCDWHDTCDCECIES